MSTNNFECTSGRINLRRTSRNRTIVINWNPENYTEIKKGVTFSITNIPGTSFKDQRNRINESAKKNLEKSPEAETKLPETPPKKESDENELWSVNKFLTYLAEKTNQKEKEPELNPQLKTELAELASLKLVTNNPFLRQFSNTNERNARFK